MDVMGLFRFPSPTSPIESCTLGSIPETPEKSTAIAKPKVMGRWMLQMIVPEFILGPMKKGEPARQKIKVFFAQEIFSNLEMNTLRQTFGPLLKAQSSFYLDLLVNDASKISSQMVVQKSIYHGTK